MIPIKILCGCGQKYAFDVESGAGILGLAIQCPTCGADGAAAAHEVIATYSAPQPVRANGLQLRAQESPRHVEIPFPPRIDVAAQTRKPSNPERKWFLPSVTAALLLILGLIGALFVRNHSRKPLA